VSDKLYTYPVDRLLKWILSELKQDKIFSYYKELFFRPKSSDLFRMQRYNQVLDNPLGVAAGPHTQLSQNIVLSWLFGARYIELKTVQVLDNIEVSKPCIDMQDEGYNCEWSQELSIYESFNQYLDAWIILHILKDMFGYELGCIFNISVGYDLKGIKSEKVQWFLSKMKNASEELAHKTELLSKIYPGIRDLKIPAQISNNVTLSTMHGCPPNEIESIAKYLIEEWKFHTAVKFNPTLLGKEKLRELLNTKLGYKISIPDEAFEHDITFSDSIKIIKNLNRAAGENKVEFGVKLTNTLESLNKSKWLPESEKMIYMSGRALHPITVNTAALLQNEFDGNLDISFSGGADAFNFADLIASNLKPVTVCSDLLKPGGYSRLPQYLQNLHTEMIKYSAGSISEFIAIKGNSNDVNSAGLNYLNEYAERTLTSKQYYKSFAKNTDIKTKRKLTELDCIHAPCIETCAVSQKVPEYLYHAANNDFAKSFEAILEDNALPNITGMVCDHLCQTKCTRINIDNSLLIREVKRFTADYESKDFENKHISNSGYKAAIIGAGPSGLSAAYFLAQAGLRVDVYESHERGGGMAASTIPVFRISDDSLEHDVNYLKSIGVNFHFKQTVDYEQFQNLVDNYKFVYVAVGAQRGKPLNITGENNKGVLDQITFLEAVKNNQNIKLGKSVAVIGGGNSAMDAARTAKRLISNINGEVTVVYRRTISEMPADKEEVEALLEEGINVYELTAPKSISKSNGKLDLTCIKMELGETDDSGRRRPVPIDESDFILVFDNIITAIGQEVLLDFLPGHSLDINPVTKETNFVNIYAGGDAVRGADSLINAMADGKDAALQIIAKINSSRENELRTDPKISLKDYQEKLSRRVYSKTLPTLPLENRNSFDLVNPLPDKEFIIEEASRCLYCDEVCNICVSVCPNLANYYYETDPVKIEYPVIHFENDKYHITGQEIFEVNQKYQIFNINDFCNECGNCDTFCPTSGAPYKVKPKFSLSEKSFNEDDKGYLIKDDKLFYKENGTLHTLSIEDDKIHYSNNDYEAVFKTDFTIVSIKNKTGSRKPEVRKIAEMYFYLISLKESFISI
jgi:putative selenate reductase